MKVAVFALGTVMLATSVSAAPCQIAHSVYHDADGKGFELIFGPSIPGTGSSHATATINHPQQGQLYRFNVTQSNGYGSIFLVSINVTDNGIEYGDSFGINFFDQSFRSATPVFLGEETDSPEYAFVTGLGSYDYYQRRGTTTESAPPFLYDVMWVHDRCQ